MAKWAPQQYTSGMGTSISFEGEDMETQQLCLVPIGQRWSHGHTWLQGRLGNLLSYLSAKAMCLATVWSGALLPPCCEA